MHRSFSFIRAAGAARRLILVGAVGVASGCANTFELRIALEPGTDGAGNLVDTGGIQTLRVAAATAQGESFDVLPVDRNAPVRTGSVQVVSEEPFTVDVWGCSGTDCAPSDVTHRGCGGPYSISINAPSPRVIALEMFASDDPAVLGCPPPLGGASG